MADLATLKIVVDANGAIRAVDQFGKATEKAAKTSELLAASAKRIGFATAGVAAAGLALVIKNTMEAEKVQAQLAAVLNSTGMAAGRSANQLNESAAALQRVTSFGDEAIGSVQALLLTFTKIRGTVFDQAVASTLDLATALGTDAKGAAIQLGKALNDPILGVTALGRAGVQFSEAQKAQIKNFVETNQLAKAQGLILAELNTQVAGSATAYRNTLGGALDAVRNSFGDLFEVSSPGMKNLVENVNLLADLIGLIPTRLEQAKVGFLSFLNRSSIAILEFNQRGRPSAMLDRLRESQSGFDTRASGLSALAAEQMAAVIASAVARSQAGMPKTLGALNVDAVGTSATAAAVTVSKLDGQLKRLDGTLADIDPQVAKADRALKDFFADMQRNAEDVADKLAQGTVDAIKGTGNAEVGRVFTEQTQVSLARFGSDFLAVGTRSVGDLFRSFAQLGRDALGQVFARAFMDRFGDQLSKAMQGPGMGVAAGVYGGILTTIVASLDRSARRAEAVADAARSIRDFADRAAPLNNAQRVLLDLTKERDALAAQAARAAGYTGGNGTIDSIRAGAQNTISNLSLGGITTAERAIINRLQDLLKSLGELDAAFAANVEAAKEAVAAEKRLEAQRQAANLKAFRDSLLLSAQSPLSPSQQLTEARSQYDAIRQLALGGDASAIDSLPQTARALLDAARGVFASGTRYADEFNRVRADLELLINSRGAAGDDPARGTDLILERTEDWVLATTEGTAKLVEVQTTGFQAVVEELQKVSEELTVLKYVLKTGFTEVVEAV